MATSRSKEQILAEQQQELEECWAIVLRLIQKLKQASTTAAACQEVNNGYDKDDMELYDDDVVENFQTDDGHSNDISAAARLSDTKEEKKPFDLLNIIIKDPHPTDLVDTVKIPFTSNSKLSLKMYSGRANNSPFLKRNKLKKVSPKKSPKVSGKRKLNDNTNPLEKKSKYRTNEKEKKLVTSQTGSSNTVVADSTLSSHTPIDAGKKLDSSRSKISEIAKTKRIETSQAKTIYEKVETVMKAIPKTSTSNNNFMNKSLEKNAPKSRVSEPVVKQKVPPSSSAVEKSIKKLVVGSKESVEKLKGDNHFKQKSRRTIPPELISKPSEPDKSGVWAFDNAGLKLSKTSISNVNPFLNPFIPIQFLPPPWGGFFSTTATSLPNRNDGKNISSSSTTGKSSSPSSRMLTIKIPKVMKAELNNGTTKKSKEEVSSHEVARMNEKKNESSTKAKTSILEKINIGVRQMEKRNEKQQKVEVTKKKDNKEKLLFKESSSSPISKVRHHCSLGKTGQNNHHVKLSTSTLKKKEAPPIIIPRNQEMHRKQEAHYTIRPKEGSREVTTTSANEGKADGDDILMIDANNNSISSITNNAVLQSEEDVSKVSKIKAPAVSVTNEKIDTIKRDVETFSPQNTVVTSNSDASDDSALDEFVV